MKKIDLTKNEKILLAIYREQSNRTQRHILAEILGFVQNTLVDDDPPASKPKVKPKGKPKKKPRHSTAHKPIKVWGKEYPSIRNACEEFGMLNTYAATRRKIANGMKPEDIFPVQPRRKK